MDIKTFYYINNNHKTQFTSFNNAFAANKELIIDKIGIIQFIKFLYPLYNRTFIKNIKFGYEWNNGEKLNFKYDETQEGYSKKKEIILWDILNNSLEEICVDKKKVYGVGNSGGLDSRIILYILNQLKIKILGYTFGDYPSDACYIANKTARILNIYNKILPIENDFLEKYWEIVIKTKPMYSLLYSWYYSALKNLPNFDTNITGFNGDNMLGSHLSRELFDIKNKRLLYLYIYNHYSVVSDELLGLILRDKNLLKLSYGDYLQNITRSENTKNENIFDEFNFKSRQLKYIINSINFDFCGAYNWESPFSSRSFIEFALNLTSVERYKRNLCYNMARRFMNELEKLRFERSFNSLKDKNIIKINTKRILWNLDKKLNLNLYFKGPHKDIVKWLIQSKSLEFIERAFSRPSKLFDEIFKSNLILKNIRLIFRKNISLLFNLLTIKLWLENYSIE